MIFYFSETNISNLFHISSTSYDIIYLRKYNLRSIFMKQKLFLMLGGFFFFAGTLSAVNQFPNPDFEHGLAGYMLGNGCRFEYREHQFVPTKNGYALEIFFRPSDNPWGYALRNDVGLFTPEVPIPPKTTYEFRFTAKSSVPGQNIICGEYSYHLGDVSFTGNTHYLTFSDKFRTYTFTVKNDTDSVRWSGFNIFRRIDRSLVRNERESITFKDLRFGPVGDLETRKVPLSASLAIEGDPMVLGYQPGSKVTIRITKLNRLPKERKSRLVLLLKSRRNEKVLLRKEMTLLLPPGKSEETLSLTLPKRFGSARLEGTLDGKNLVNAVKFTIVPKVRLKRGDLPLDLGTNNIMSLPEAKFHLDEQMKLLADGGFTCLRIWDTGNCFAWHRIEPEDGKFDWKRADIFVNAARRENLDLLPVLGGVFTLDNTLLPWGRREPIGAELPIWLYQRSKTTISGTIPSPNAKTVLPPMKDWERMVRACAEHYSGKIHMWEILNESEIYLDKELYVPYLIHAYKILKKIDPGCTVVGGGLTGDFGNDITSGLEGFLRLAGKHTDGLSFHPYGSIYEDAGRMPADMLFTRAKEALEKTGNPLPLWNTEVYYLSPKSRGGGTHSVGPVFDPGYQVRRYLIDAANGVEVSMMLPGRYMLTNMINDNVTGDYLGAFFANRILPGDKYVVSALFAKNMKQFQYEKTLALPGRMLAYLFRKGKIRTAYLFSLSVKENDPRIIHYPHSGNGVECRDLYDEPLTLKTGKASPIPIRITGPGDSVERFLKSIRVENDQPILFYGMRLVRTPDRYMDLYVDAEPCGSDSLQVGGLEELRMPPGRRTHQIRIPQTLASKFNRQKKGSLTVNGESRSCEISQSYEIPEFSREPVFDPELRDPIWNTAWIRNVGTGTIRVGIFRGKLYFACTVKKEKLYRNMNDPAIYLSDSVELFLDGKPFEELRYPQYARTSKTARQLMFLPPFGEKSSRVSGNTGAEWKDLKYAFKVYPGSYNLIVSFPFSAFGGSEQKAFGFDCAINSWIGKDWRKYTLSTNKEIFMNRFQFELLKTKTATWK